MVLRNASSQYDSSCFFSFHGNFGDFFMIFNNVDVKIVFVGVSKQNVSDTSVSYRWAKHRNIILIAPVVDAFLIVDLLAKPIDKLPRGPSNIILLLLLCHLCVKRQQKILKFHVVIIRHKDISDSAVPIQPVLNVVHVELSQVESSHAFHYVLLDSSSCGDDAVNHLVLGQVANDIAHSTRSHVGCISQEDGAPNFSSIGGVTSLLVVSLVQGLVGEPPADHVVDDLDGLMEMSGLEAHRRETLEELFIINSLVKVVAFDASRLQLLAFKEHILDLLLNSLRGYHFGLVVHSKRIQFSRQTKQFIITLNFPNISYVFQYLLVHMTLVNSCIKTNSIRTYLL